MTASGPIRIAVVEDDPVIRRYFMKVLSAEADFDVLGLAPDLATARRMISLEPDLFLLDIGLPDGNGYELVPAIKAACAAKVLIISAFGDRDTVVAALRAGADGYLLKDSSPATIADGIRMTVDGGSPVSPAAAVYLLDFLRQVATDPADAGTKAVPASEDRLTSREAELLSEFAAGCSYKEAARNLGISPHTVGNHVKAIYRKLEVNSRSEAIREARRGGEISS